MKTLKTLSGVAPCPCPWRRTFTRHSRDNCTLAFKPNTQPLCCHWRRCHFSAYLQSCKEEGI